MSGGRALQSDAFFARMCAVAILPLDVCLEDEFLVGGGDESVHQMTDRG